MTIMKILLIGYRGSGKTTVGRLLAQRLSFPLVDIDDRITARTGLSVKEIFDQHGEAGFRRFESKAIAESFAADQWVIAAGGGAMTIPANRDAIPADCHVVLLHADPAELHRRIAADPTSTAGRPALTAAGGLSEIHQLLQHRLPIYRGVSTLELDTTNLTPGDVVDRVVAHLQGSK
jgi:shikimate kinase